MKEEIDIKVLDTVKDDVFVLVSNSSQEMVIIFNYVSCSCVEYTHQHWTEIGKGDCTFELDSMEKEEIKEYFNERVDI